MFWVNSCKLALRHWDVCSVCTVLIYFLLKSQRIKCVLLHRFVLHPWQLRSCANKAKQQRGLVGLLYDRGDGWANWGLTVISWKTGDKCQALFVPNTVPLCLPSWLCSATFLTWHAFISISLDSPPFSLTLYLFSPFLSLVLPFFPLPLSFPLRMMLISLY